MRAWGRRRPFRRYTVHEMAGWRVFNEVVRNFPVTAAYHVRLTSDRTMIIKRKFVWIVAILAGAAVGGAPHVVSGQAAPAGEFQVGDRIALSVIGEPTLSDTFPVRAGRILTLPNLRDIPLAGIQRSAVQPYLARQIGAYVKNAEVRAIPLVRVGVLGEVGRPGYYFVPAEALLSDVVMVAGGPTGTADLNRTVVKRGNRDVRGSKEVSRALTSGQTIAQLGVTGGDQVVVGAKRGNALARVVAYAGTAASLAYLYVLLRRR